MIRGLHRLSAATVKNAKLEPGQVTRMLADGGGLYLQLKKIGETETRSWIFRYAAGRKVKSKASGKERFAERFMGLGPLCDLSLSEARKKAADLRQRRRDGIDPIDARRAERAQAAVAAVKLMSFEQCAEAYIKKFAPTWRGLKTEKGWRTSLKRYAYPVIAKLPPGTVNTDMMIQILDPIWSKKPETAVRVRGRIEKILDWAKVAGLRKGENPALWRGNLDKLLPKISKKRRVKHHTALPYQELGAFMAELRACEDISARALEFTILTIARTGETIGAQWSEIDPLYWAIPAARMKMEKDHRVPLSDPARAILAKMASIRENNFVFPGKKRARQSNMAMLMLLRRLNRKVTVHGFRATFKTWATECTNFPREVIELAMSHEVGTDVEQAYQRGEMLEKRRKLMDAWAKFCGTVKQADNVTSLFAAAQARA